MPMTFGGGRIPFAFRNDRRLRLVLTAHGRESSNLSESVANPVLLGLSIALSATPAATAEERESRRWRIDRHPPTVRMHSTASGTVASGERAYAAIENGELRVGWLEAGWSAYDAVPACGGLVVLASNLEEETSAIFVDSESGPVLHRGPRVREVGDWILAPTGPGFAWVDSAEAVVHLEACDGTSKIVSFKVENPLVEEEAREPHPRFGRWFDGRLLWATAAFGRLIRSRLDVSKASLTHDSLPLPDGMRIPLVLGEDWMAGLSGSNSTSILYDTDLFSVSDTVRRMRFRIDEREFGVDYPYIYEVRSTRGGECAVNARRTAGPAVHSMLSTTSMAWVASDRAPLVRGERDDLEFVDIDASGAVVRVSMNTPGEIRSYVPEHPSRPVHRRDRLRLPHCDRQSIPRRRELRRRGKRSSP